MKTLTTILTIILAFFAYSTNAQVMVKEITPGKDSTYIRSLTNVNGSLFFVGSNSGIWKSDGTESGTVNINKHIPDSIMNVNGILYYLSPSYIPGTGPFGQGRYTDGRSLWKYDSTVQASSAKMVMEYPGDVGQIVNVNGVVFFATWAANLVRGNQLWKIDRAAREATVVKTYGDMGYLPKNLCSFKGALFFSGWDPSHGQELWKSDGTESGTVLVKNINAVYTSTGDTQGSQPENLIDVNGTLFFTADDGIHGRQLWKSDGSETGTVLVKEVQPGFHLPFLGTSISTVVNGNLFFSLDGNNHSGVELWKSDGTAKGTGMVKDINAVEYGRYGSFPNELTNVNGTLFFAANDGIHGTELWKSNGTTAGTVMVKDINVPPPDRSFYADSTGSIAPLRNYGPSDNSFSFTNVTGVLYFCADDGVHGAELWKSDGTAAGTIMVKDIKPFGNFGSHPRNLIYINGTLFFTADDGPHGNELWKYVVPAK